MTQPTINELTQLLLELKPNTKSMQALFNALYGEHTAALNHYTLHDISKVMQLFHIYHESKIAFFDK